MKIIKNILKIVLWLFLLIIITYNLYNFISLKVLKKDITSIFGYTALEVVSGSMEPTINVSDVIIINQNKMEYKKNDIITFIDVNGSFVTHRIVDITSKGYVTKGDANKTIDPGFIKKDKIIGEYVFKLNGLGQFIKAIKNPITLILIFIIGIMVCVIISVNKDMTSLKISDEEKEFLKQKENKNKAQDLENNSKIKQEKEGE